MNLGLDARKRQQIVCGLNQYLANLQVLYIKIHNYHWNVVGCNFFDFHERLQEIYEYIADEIDKIAERIKMLGCMPIANLESALRVATIKGAPSTNFSAPTIAQSVIYDFTVIVNQIKKLSKFAGQNCDDYTAGLLSEASGFYEKYIWFFCAYLTPTCGPCS